jgi:4-hydroxy-4-methyl-2-oxoglutarate aldolase
MNPESDIYRAAAAYSSATLLEANGGKGALPSDLRPIDPRRKLSGHALPIECAAGDNLWLHRALLRANAGDVLVCTVAGDYEHGYWGEILTCAAMVKGVVGLVIDGGVRDADRIEALGFPVFARRLCIRGTTKQTDARGSVGNPITIGDCIVRLGDLIFGDRDGLFAVGATEIPAVLRAAADREAKEQTIVQRLRGGESTMEVYGWK